MSEFNVNAYWLERGRNYMEEKRTPAEFHRLQERFLLEVLKATALPMQKILEIERLWLFAWTPSPRAAC